MHLIMDRGPWRYLLGVLAVIAVSSPAWADIPAEPPPSWIYDGAELLTSAEYKQLTVVKERLEKETGARLVVVTLAKNEGESPKSIAVRVLNQWNAGTRSALLLVLLSPRELYLQPGTDLATVLDAETSSFICSAAIAPKLQLGERAAAIRIGLETIAARITNASTHPKPLTQASAATKTPTAQESQQPQGVAATVRSLGSHPAAGFVAYAVGLAALVAGVFGLKRLFARKCPECGTGMAKTSEVTMPATYTSAGEGRHTFTCHSCSRTFSEIYFIAQLTESKTTNSITSDSTTSSWTSSSSYDSSSWSSSSSDSSSSSSSDGSGGGGSTW